MAQPQPGYGGTAGIVTLLEDLIEIPLNREEIVDESWTGVRICRPNARKRWRE